MTTKNSFDLLFDTEKEEFVVIIKWGLINEYIFKKAGQWVDGFGLNAHDFTTEDNGNKRFKFGKPSLEFVASFSEWRQAKDGIEIEQLKTGKKLQLSKDEITKMLAAVHKRDRRIKV